MVQQRDISRSTTAFVPDETLVVVVEITRSTWLVAGSSIAALLSSSSQTRTV
jgi:phenylpyruvate tautomerase PptA (4-oxalocrotonate tautomerase family)